MADGPAAEVAEAHVHADECLDAGSRAGDEVEEPFRPVGVAGEARLVELDEGGAGRGEGAHLAIDDGQDRLRDDVAVTVDVAALQTAGERVRPGDGDFGGRVGYFAKPAELVDEAQSVRRGERRDAEIFRPLVVRR